MKFGTLNPMDAFARNLPDDVEYRWSVDSMYDDDEPDPTSTTLTVTVWGFDRTEVFDGRPVDEWQLKQHVVRIATDITLTAPHIP